MDDPISNALNRGSVVKVSLQGCIESHKKPKQQLIKKKKSHIGQIKKRSKMYVP